MKKLWIVGMILGTMFVAGCGGSDKVYYNTSKTYTTSTNGVPNEVLNKFHDMFPAAQGVNWNVKDGLYKADFNLGNNNMDATYSSNGDLVKVNG
jgi:hypothetical protein